MFLALQHLECKSVNFVPRIKNISVYFVYLEYMREHHVGARALECQSEEAFTGSYEPLCEWQEPNPALIDLLSFLELLMF